MRPVLDKTGNRYHHLTVVARSPDKNKFGHIMWVCQCDCGNRVTVAGGNLQSGNTKSCGCLPTGRKKKPKPDGKILKTRLGPYKTQHPLYGVLHDILGRCREDGDADYGGRGIRVCDDWANPVSGFASFVRDMYESWKPGMTIERIDVEKGYSSDNCRWIPMSLQSRNRRCDRDIEVTHPDGTKTIVVSGFMSSFCRKYGLNFRNLSDVLNHRYTHHRGYRASYLEHKIPGWLRPFDEHY